MDKLLCHSEKHRFRHLPEVDPEIIPPEVEEEVRREFEVDGVDEGEGQNGDVHVDYDGLAFLVARDQLLGIVGTKAQVGALVLITLVHTVNLRVAAVTLVEIVSKFSTARLEVLEQFCSWQQNKIHYDRQFLARQGVKASYFFMLWIE